MPLLLKCKTKTALGEEICDEDDPKEDQKPVTSIMSAYQLLSPSVKVYTLRCSVVSFGKTTSSK